MRSLAVGVILLGLVRAASAQEATPAADGAEPLPSARLLGLVPADATAVAVVRLDSLLAPKRLELLRPRVGALLTRLGLDDGRGEPDLADLEARYLAPLAAHVAACAAWTGAEWGPQDWGLVCDGDWQAVGWAGLSDLDPEPLGDGTWVAGPARDGARARLDEPLDTAKPPTVGGVALDATALLQLVAEVPPALAAAAGLPPLSGLERVEVRVGEPATGADPLTVNVRLVTRSPEGAVQLAALLELAMASWRDRWSPAVQTAVDSTPTRLASWVSVDGSAVRVRPDLDALCLPLALATPELVQAVRAADATEATAELDALTDEVRARYAATAAMPAAPAGPTPDPVPCGAPVAVAPETWDTAGWSEVGFAPTEPLRFSYALRPGGTEAPGSVVLSAEGDLDCDGVRSTYERVVTAGADGTLTVGDVTVQSGLE